MTTPPTFIPGWQATIEIGSPTTDLTVVGNVLTFPRSRASLPKATFGTPFRHEIPGQASGTLSCSGHVSAEIAPSLEALWADGSGVSLPFSMQIGTAGEVTDGGSYDGFLVIAGFQLGDTAEGEWEWSIDANLDGEPTYTPTTFTP